MRQRFFLLASIIALTLSDSFSAPDFKASSLQPKPGRKYSTIERMRPERLRAVNEDRSRYERARHTVSLATGYTDYRGIMHAHTDDSSHTGGTRRELIAAAKSAGVQIVMLTDHVHPPSDFVSADTRGLFDGALLIPGAESEGFLVFPQRSMINSYVDKKFSAREEFIKASKEAGGLLFLSHVEEKLDWPMDEIEGMEIYNNHTDFDDEKEFIRWLRLSFIIPERLKQLEQALADYPMEVFGASQDYLERIIAKWDRALIRRRATGVAANDCHHNQVFTVTAAPPDGIMINTVGASGRKVTIQQAPRVAEMIGTRPDGDVIAKLDFDPYERSLRYITTHFLMRELNEDSVRQTLRQSRVYVAHDWLCDPTGFAFIMDTGGKLTGVMGDELKMRKGMKLRLEAPVAGLIKLFLNGEVINESRSDRLSHAIDQPGVYRAEIWLEIDGEMRPWIYANPIRVVM